MSEGESERHWALYHVRIAAGDPVGRLTGRGTVHYAIGPVPSDDDDEPRHSTDPAQAARMTHDEAMAALRGLHARGSVSWGIADLRE